MHQFGGSYFDGRWASWVQPPGEAGGWRGEVHVEERSHGDPASKVAGPGFSNQPSRGNLFQDQPIDYLWTSFKPIPQTSNTSIYDFET